MNRLTSALLMSVPVVLASCGGDGKVPVPVSTSSQVLSTTAVPAPITQPPADKTCGLANFQQEVLDRLNQARASNRMCGNTFSKAVGPLSWNGKLFEAAAAHATDMATKNYFSHESQDGRIFSERITATGYNWTAVGENIAAGQTSVEQVINNWLQSPAHCDNIMNGSFSEVGAACVRNDASTYKQYWTLELGRPK
ncbi:CAP domain-containing protein [Herbaspirillum sp. ST 5-3]|uniref:CAP domain-containing protein n=1 Tax=Oxalobacteraceae TaxID=75682 RepID=UPI001FFE714D|nr:CAP domain-containing protein [Herbaspirillum sp. ST 5-3]